MSAMISTEWGRTRQSDEECAAAGCGATRGNLAWEAEQEALAIVQKVEPRHLEAVRLTQHRGAALPRGLCLSGAAFDALAVALAAFVDYTGWDHV
jgi:hypothetical protein